MKKLNRKSASPPPFEEDLPLHHTLTPFFNFSGSYHSGGRNQKLIKRGGDGGDKLLYPHGRAPPITKMLMENPTFYLPNCLKNKSFLKIKKNISRYHHFTNVYQKIMIIWCTVLDIWCLMDGQTRRQIDGQKKWHIGVGAPHKN